MKLLDRLGLLLGQHLGADVVETELPGHGLGGSPVVAGQHDHFQIRLVELPHGLGRRLLDRIGDAEHAGQAAVDRHEHHGLPLIAKRIGSRRRNSPGSMPSASSKLERADGHLVAVDLALDPFARLGLE